MCNFVTSPTVRLFTCCASGSWHVRSRRASESPLLSSWLSLDRFALCLFGGAYNSKLFVLVSTAGCLSCEKTQHRRHPSPSGGNATFAGIAWTPRQRLLETQVTSHCFEIWMLQPCYILSTATPDSVILHSGDTGPENSPFGPTVFFSARYTLCGSRSLTFISIASATLAWPPARHAFATDPYQCAKTGL